MKIENILERKGRSVETIAPHAPVTMAIQPPRHRWDRSSGGLIGR